MLNGTAPILIFTFPFDVPELVGNNNPFSQRALNFIQRNVGLPIPIYLSENLTGIFVESESKSVDIENNILPSFDPKVPNLLQRGLETMVTVNLIAHRDALLLNVLVAMGDLIFSRLAKTNYSVSYINGKTTVFGGLLKSLTSSENSDDELVRLVLQISKGANPVTPPGTQTSIVSVPNETVLNAPVPPANIPPPPPPPPQPQPSVPIGGLL